MGGASGSWGTGGEGKRRQGEGEEREEEEEETGEEEGRVMEQWEHVAWSS